MFAVQENEHKKLPFENLLLFIAFVAGGIGWGICLYEQTNIPWFWLFVVAVLGAIAVFIGANIGLKFGYYIRDRSDIAAFHAKDQFDALTTRWSLDYKAPFMGLFFGALVGWGVISLVLNIFGVI